MVLFAGQDTSGNPDLWVTDGTSAGPASWPSPVPIPAGCSI
jgi:hypothetical protein